MTLAEYMDPERFPLTTQKGLRPEQQLMIDAFNYDDVRTDREEGREVRPEDAALVAELEAKNAARAEVMAELRAKERAGR